MRESEYCSCFKRSILKRKRISSSAAVQNVGTISSKTLNCRQKPTSKFSTISELPMKEFIWEETEAEKYFKMLNVLEKLISNPANANFPAKTRSELKSLATHLERVVFSELMIDYALLQQVHSHLDVGLCLVSVIFYLLYGTNNTVSGQLPVLYLNPYFSKLI